MEWTNFGDTTGCVFHYLLKWGDGASQFGNVNGGPVGSYVLAKHTYTAAGTYTMSFTGNVVSGNCIFEPGVAQFTYNAPAEFTVKGSLAVMPSSSQDTHAQAPRGSVCQPRDLSHAQAQGSLVKAYFFARGASDAITLLDNFLAATRKPINLGAGSKAAKELPTNSEFQKLNARIDQEIRRQLNAGAPAVSLDKGTLSRISLDEPADLHYSFGGTQGIVVTGSGHLSGGYYIGTLTYKIEDSYGYSTKDHLYGFGDALRYLQTVCGNPPQKGGAHWFPDSVTATVNFKIPR